MIYSKDYSDLSEIIGKSLHILPSDIDLIVGVSRSGIIPASMIALALNKPLTNTDILRNGIGFSAGPRGGGYRDWKDFSSERLKILVVDDSISSGRQLQKTKAELSGVSECHDLYFLCIYGSPAMAHKPDFCFEVVPGERVFAWNIMHSWATPHSCIDIDGVLCRDPTETENDDSVRYIEFIRHAKPMIIPSNQVGTIVTCRLSKYRDLTEEWLANQGVSYNHLRMMEYATKEERMKADCYSEYKADIFKKSGCFVFVESSRQQAQEIARLSQKLVYCIENQRFYRGSISGKDIGCTHGKDKVTQPGFRFSFLKKAKGIIISRISRAG